MPVTQSWPISVDRKSLQPLAYLFERILAVPASSAPVERILSKSGLTARPHCAKNVRQTARVTSVCRVFTQVNTSHTSVTQEDVT